MNQPDIPVYDNADRKCECWKCELSCENGGDCPFDQKLQRHPADLQRGGLGLCKKLKGAIHERKAL